MHTEQGLTLSINSSAISSTLPSQACNRGNTHLVGRKTRMATHKNTNICRAEQSRAWQNVHSSLSLRDGVNVYAVLYVMWLAHVQQVTWTLCSGWRHMHVMWWSHGPTHVLWNFSIKWMLLKMTSSLPFNVCGRKSDTNLGRNRCTHTHTFIHVNNNNNNIKKRTPPPYTIWTLWKNRDQKWHDIMKHASRTVTYLPRGARGSWLRVAPSTTQFVHAQHRLQATNVAGAIHL